MNIGFIGLGHMGNPMVRNLIKAGFDVHIFDVDEKALNELAQTGATAAKSIAAVVKNADVVITMVQTGEQVNAICLDANGVFQHAKPSALFIDCSSIDIKLSRALHAEAEKRGIAMIDAPVSGGVAGATAASLTFMVGGSEEHFKQALPILNTLGKKIIHAGASGNGQAAKICNNLLLGISMIGVCEAFGLAEKLGLDAKKFFEISSNASGQCWSMTSYCPAPGILENVPSSHDYKAGFMAKMMLKDLRLGKNAAEAVQATIPLGGVATELYELFVDEGFGEVDFSGIYKLIAE